MGKTYKIFIFDKNRERDVEIIEEANYCIPYSFILLNPVQQRSPVQSLGKGVQFFSKNSIKMKLIFWPK